MNEDETDGEQIFEIWNKFDGGHTGCVVPQRGMLWYVFPSCRYIGG